MERAEIQSDSHGLREAIERARAAADGARTIAQSGSHPSDGNVLADADAIDAVCDALSSHPVQSESDVRIQEWIDQLEGAAPGFQWPVERIAEKLRSLQDESVAGPGQSEGSG